MVDPDDICKTCGKPKEENDCDDMEVIIGCPDGCTFNEVICMWAFDAVPSEGDKHSDTCSECGKNYIVKRVDDAVCNS